MNQTNNVHFELIPASDAQLFCAERFENLQPAEGRLALAIVTALHSRHVGITPQLAAGLAQILLNASIKPDGFPAPWDAVHQKLRATLRDLSNVPDFGRETAESSFVPLRFNASISYTVLRLAAPLVNQAVEQNGRAFLFCADDDGIRSIKSDTYHQYEAALSSNIYRLAGEEMKPHQQLFWQEKAIMLSSLTLKRSRSGVSPSVAMTQNQGASEHRLLPTVSDPNLSLFLTLQPDMRKREKRTKRQYQMAVRPQLRERYLPEAGADGVFVTRSPEDMQRMLVSEMSYPEIERLDRLFNSGFFAIERPPKPVRLRDILVVGLFPGTNGLQTSDIFSKTCWFEFLLHFSRLLKQSDMSRSELRWIEGDVYRRIRSISMMVNDLPDIPLTLNENNLQSYRQHFLMKLGWLPSYLDDYAYFDPLPLWEQGFSSSNDNRVKEGYEAWVKAAWQAQKEDARWTQKKDQGYRRKHILMSDSEQPLSLKKWRLDQFAYVHLMIFLPRSLRQGYLVDEDEAGQVSADGDQQKRAILDRPTMHYRSLLRHKAHSGMSLSITWMPENAGSSDWYFSGRNYSGPVFEENDLSLGSKAGRLVETWLANITKEMQRG